ncbi:MAG: EAL domain-containing protein [Cellvibrionaceae bacterium]
MYKLKDFSLEAIDAANHEEHKLGGYRFFDFRSHYQPIVELSSGLIAGYEALARREDISGDFVSAGAVFCDRNLPRRDKLLLDRYLRKMALGEVSSASDTGFITLNISPDWIDGLSDTSPIPTLEMVRQAGVDPSRVIVEITEHGGSLENLKRLTKAYQAAGIKVAIDDFGAGASQIDRVIELEPDLIKLDMALFKSAVLGGYAADVVLSIVSMAQRAGCKIICEGVETEEEFYFAIECGADYIQGWLFDPALPAWLSSSSYRKRIDSMKAGYLQQKSRLLESSARHNQEVAQTLQRMSRRLSSRDVLSDIVENLPVSQARRLGVLQFFLCDPQGNQISDNVIVGDDCLRLNDQYRGYNWSHRPYFPLLNAMNRLQHDHIVVSDAYRDISTGQLCKTHGVFLSKDRVLLIDVLSEDVVLFKSEDAPH